jgi:hypothetical protein
MWGEGLATVGRPCREGREVEMKGALAGREILYYSTGDGQAKQKDGQDTVYVGYVSRMSREDFTDKDKREAYFNKDMEQAKALITTLSEGFQIVDPMERYEVFDKETNDILIMWRIPTRQKKTRPLRPIIGPTKNIIQ